MVLRERASVIVELAIAVIATSLLVIATEKPAEREATHAWNRGDACVRLVDEPSFNPHDRYHITVPSHPEAAAKADALYRKKEFWAAARVLRETHDESLEPLAQLYVELGRSYYGGTDPGSPVDEMFEALVVARRVDIVLGGTHLDVIVRALIEKTPKAAIVYTAKGDYDHARIAVAIADQLGIGSNTSIRVVRTQLAKHH